MLDEMYTDKFIERALREDMPLGDITTDNLIPEDAVSKAKFIAKAPGVVAGIDIAERVFLKLDPNAKFTIYIKDGQRVVKGTVIAEVEASTRALLKAERTALNILQHLSGVATATNTYVEELAKAEGTKAYIADTRKILPGLRLMDKYAVRMGGGRNHRFSLSDGVMIKDNHIKACGSISAAVKKVRAAVPHTVKIEVETADLDQVREALSAGADIIMLDNMDIKTMTEAVKIIGKKAITEASGNVTPERLREIASTGVDLISAGAITHSASALDISMKFV